MKNENEKQESKCVGFKTHTDSNTIDMCFSEDDPFDASILEKAQEGFISLNPKEDINVNLIGPVPIEILAYVLEVANHCNMIIDIMDDEKGFAFLSHLKNTQNVKIEINYKGEVNG